MGVDAMRRYRRMRLASVMPTTGLAKSEIFWIVGTVCAMTGLLAVLLFLPLVGCATVDGGDEYEWDPSRQGLVQAHPEWPPEVGAAVMAGVICAGMPPDMVRAGWGPPTHRTSDGDGPDQRKTWHYAGRPRAVEWLGGPEGGNPRSGEWTVSFVHGRVVEWTD
jgi:hypothetical protein